MTISALVLLALLTISSNILNFKKSSESIYKTYSPLACFKAKFLASETPLFL